MLAVALARAGFDVLASDASAAAVASAAATASANGVADRVRVTRDDALSGVEPGSVDLVVCNPPFHQGTTVHAGIADRLFAAAARVLRRAVSCSPSTTRTCRTARAAAAGRPDPSARPRPPVHRPGVEEALTAPAQHRGSPADNRRGPSSRGWPISRVDDAMARTVWSDLRLGRKLAALVGSGVLALGGVAVVGALAQSDAVAGAERRARRPTRSG